MPRATRPILSPAMWESRIARLLETYRRVADTGSFFTMWLKKIEWMLANGYRPDALHALWIALGLRVKDASAGDIGVADRDLERACSRWLNTIGWDWETTGSKAAELRGLTDRFCQSDALERERNR